MRDARNARRHGYYSRLKTDELYHLKYKIQLAIRRLKVREQTDASIYDLENLEDKLAIIDDILNIHPSR